MRDWAGCWAGAAHRDDERAACGGEGVQHCNHVMRHLGVEPGRWLVDEQHCRVGEQLDADRNTLALAAAEPTSPASTDSVRLLQSGPPAFGWHAVRGLLVSAAGGLCFGFFSPLFNIAVNDEFGWRPGGRAGGLTVWTVLLLCGALDLSTLT